MPPPTDSKAQVSELRNTGIEALGALPWGSHICQFYETKEDLLDILVPFFKAGLESNEYCFWVVSEPLTGAEVLHAMRSAVPDFDQRLVARQIDLAVVPA